MSSPQKSGDSLDLGEAGGCLPGRYLRSSERGGGQGERPASPSASLPGSL